MGRKYLRKTAKIAEDNLQRAVQDVTVKKLSVNRAALNNGIAQPTLWRYLKEMKSQPSENVKIKKAGQQPIFCEEEEFALMRHIVKCSNIYHGLSPMQVRILAFDFAKRLGKNVPNWEQNQMGNFFKHKACYLN